MKQKLIWMVLLLAGIQVYSSAQVISRQKPQVAENGIRGVIVSDNIDVLLIQSTDGAGWVKVPDNTLGKVKASIVDENLYLSAVSGLPESERLQVYIQVEDLNMLVLKDVATVVSRGILNLQRLEVIVAENARAILRTTGDVHVVKHGKYAITKENDHSLVYAAD